MGAETYPSALYVKLPSECNHTIQFYHKIVCHTLYTREIQTKIDNKISFKCLTDFAWNLSHGILSVWAPFTCPAPTLAHSGLAFSRSISCPNMVSCERAGQPEQSHQPGLSARVLSKQSLLQKEGCLSWNITDIIVNTIKRKKNSSLLPFLKAIPLENLEILSLSLWNIYTSFFKLNSSFWLEVPPMSFSRTWEPSLCNVIIKSPRPLFPSFYRKVELPGKGTRI